MLQPISERHSFSRRNHTHMARGLTGLCREGEGNMTEKAVGRGGARRVRIPEERSLAAPPVLCGMVNECVDSIT